MPTTPWPAGRRGQTLSHHTLKALKPEKALTPTMSRHGLDHLRSCLYLWCFRKHLALLVLMLSYIIHRGQSMSFTFTSVRGWLKAMPASGPHCQCQKNRASEMNALDLSVFSCLFQLEHTRACGTRLQISRVHTHSS